MVDLSDKGSSCEDLMMNNSKSSGSSSSNNKMMKTCVDCGTTKTPLWRGGPAGPKSLCNACGIRSRKRRRALMGLSKGDKKTKKSTITTTTVAATSTTTGESQSSGLTSNKSDKTGDFSLKKKLMALGTQVVLQRPRSTMTKQRRKLGEEEQAAFLLMALSCGSVFA